LGQTFFNKQPLVLGILCCLGKPQGLRQFGTEFFKSRLFASSWKTSVNQGYRQCDDHAGITTMKNLWAMMGSASALAKSSQDQVSFCWKLQHAVKDWTNMQGSAAYEYG